MLRRVIRLRGSCVAVATWWLGFVVGFAFALVAAFVRVLLAFGEGDLALDAAVFEVEGEPGSA